MIKPRRRGLKMMIDQGLPRTFVGHLVAYAGGHIDRAKITTGTARLYPEHALREKRDRYKAARFKPFIGDQFHEYVVATTSGRALSDFSAEALRLGFEAIEISDDVVPLNAPHRQPYIRRAREAGLEIFGEVAAITGLISNRVSVALGDRQVG